MTQLYRKAELGFMGSEAFRSWKELIWGSKRNNEISTVNLTSYTFDSFNQDHVETGVTISRANDSASGNLFYFQGIYFRNDHEGRNA